MTQSQLYHTLSWAKEEWIFNIPVQITQHYSPSMRSPLSRPGSPQQPSTTVARPQALGTALCSVRGIGLCCVRAFRMIQLEAWEYFTFLSHELVLSLHKCRQQQLLPHSKHHSDQQCDEYHWDSKPLWCLFNCLFGRYPY